MGLTEDERRVGLFEPGEVPKVRGLAELVAFRSERVRWSGWAGWEEHSQDSFRGWLGNNSSEHHTRSYAPKLDMCRSPALMYLTCPATQTTKLPSGRPSSNCRRLRSYSEAGIPGVTSPWLTFFTRARQRMKRVPCQWVGGAGVVLVLGAHSPRWVWDVEVGWPNVDGLVGGTR
jgi:hypothetical protein